MTHGVTWQCGKLRTAPDFGVEERHLILCLFPRPFTVPVFHCRAFQWVFKQLSNQDPESRLPSYFLLQKGKTPAEVLHLCHGLP